MTRSLRAWSLWRAALVAVLLLGFGGRSAVAQGYMVQAGDAGLTVQICSEGALKTVHLGDSRPADPEDEGMGDDAPCAFAAVACLTPPEAAPAPEPLPVVATTRLVLSTADLRPGRGLAAPPPPSHAPPVLRA